MRARRRGFTMVELVLALAIGGTLLLTARLLIAAVSDTQRGADRARAQFESAVLPMRTVSQLLRRTEPGADSASMFVGLPQRMSFTTWCETAHGWLQRCRLTLAAGAEGLVLLRPGRFTTQVQKSAVLDFGFRYLETPADGGRWTPSWGTRLSAPLAVLLLLGADSVLVVIGERG